MARNLNIAHTGALSPASLLPLFVKAEQQQVGHSGGPHLHLYFKSNSNRISLCRKGGSPSIDVPGSVYIKAR